MIFNRDNSRLHRNTVTTLFAITLLIFTAVFAILVSDMTLENELTTTHFLLYSGLAAITIGALATISLTTITNTIIQRQKQIIETTFILSSLTLVTTLFELFRARAAINNDAIFSISLAINCGIIFYLIKTYGKLLNLPDSWPRFAGATMFLFTLFIGTLKISKP